MSEWNEYLFDCKLFIVIKSSFVFSWNVCKIFYNFFKCGYNIFCIGRLVKFFDNDEEKVKNVRYIYKKLKYFVFVIVNI